MTYERRQTMTDEIKVTQVRLDPSRPAQLYYRYPGWSGPGPVFLGLDTETGRLYVGLDNALEGAASGRVWVGRVVIWEVGFAPTASAANDLIDDAAPLAQQVIDCLADPLLGEDEFMTAYRAVEDLIADGDYQRVVVVDASDWLDTSSSESLGIDDCMDAGALEAAVERLQKEAAGDGIHVVEGLYAYLEGRLSGD
jgi:hypothetical protein